MSGDTLTAEVPALPPAEARAQLAEHKARGTLDTTKHAGLYRAAFPEGDDAAPAGAEDADTFGERFRAEYANARRATLAGAPLVMGEPPEAARAQIAAIRADLTHPAQDPDHRHYRVEQEKLMALYRQAYPEGVAADAAPEGAEREPLPVGWTRAPDEATFAASLATQLGTVPAEIEACIDEGHRMARHAALEGPADPEQAMAATMATLQRHYGPETDAKVALAQRLVAQAPARVREWLDETGAGNSPRLIMRVIQWAEARART